jgi:palmitoyltransferase
MISTPFLVFYIAGMTLQSSLPYLGKIAIFIATYISLHIATRYVFDERLMNVLPMALYSATKVSAVTLGYIAMQHFMYIVYLYKLLLQFWFYMTWFIWLSPTMSTMTSFLFYSTSILLWHFFYKSWRGDPGVIANTQDQKFRVSMYI